MLSEQELLSEPQSKFVNLVESKPIEETRQITEFTYEFELEEEIDPVLSSYSSTDIVPIFEVFTNKQQTQKVLVSMRQCPSFPTNPKKGENTVGTLWNKEIWYMFTKLAEKIYGLGLVKYEIFWEEQNLYWDEKKWELEEQRIREQENDEDETFDPNPTRYEDQSINDRAEAVYTRIMKNRDEIVLKIANDDYFDISNLDSRARKYFGAEPDLFDTNYDGLIYEDGFEAKNIMDELIETGAQPKSLFGDYEDYYKKLNESYGLKAGRYVYLLATKLGKVVHIAREEDGMEQEEIIESTLPTGGVKDA